MVKKFMTILFAFVILFSGCQKRPVEGQLTVTTSSWSNRNPSSTRPKVYEYDLSVGTDHTLPALNSDELTFQITSISEEGIAIKTSMWLSFFASEGVVLQDAFMEFEIKYGETLELETPTFDAGVIYNFELSKD